MEHALSHSKFLGEAPCKFLCVLDCHLIVIMYIDYRFSCKSLWKEAILRCIDMLSILQANLHHLQIFDQALVFTSPTTKYILNVRYWQGNIWGKMSYSNIVIPKILMTFVIR